MANANTKFGLRPVRMLSGGVYTGGFNTYSVASGDGTAIYIGDPVKIAGTGQTINGNVYQDVIAAATGDVQRGVVIGVAPVTNASLPYRAASTQRLLFVVDDPNVLFEIQEVGTGTALTANDIGLNANFVAAAGSTTTGYSGFELDNATEATTNTLDLKIWGLVNQADNAIGLNAKWLVQLNRHQLANQIAGV